MKGEIYNQDTKSLKPKTWNTARPQWKMEGGLENSPGSGQRSLFRSHPHCLYICFTLCGPPSPQTSMWYTAAIGYWAYTWQDGFHQNHKSPGRYTWLAQFKSGTHPWSNRLPPTEQGNAVQLWLPGTHLCSRGRSIKDCCKLSRLSKNVHQSCFCWQHPCERIPGVSPEMEQIKRLSILEILYQEQIHKYELPFSKYHPN